MSLIVADGPYVGVSALNTSFSVKEWNSATSAGYLKFTMTFAEGLVPAGMVPKVVEDGGSEVTDIQYDLRKTHADGSLHHTRVAANFGSFTSLEQKDFTVTAKSGSYNDTADHTWAEIVADVDAVVDFTNVFESESDYSLSNDIQTFSGDATVRFHVAGHSMSEGDKFYIQRNTDVGGLEMGSTVSTPPPVFTVNASPDTDWFEAEHPDGAAASDETGGGSRALYRFSNPLNDYDGDIANVINNSTYVEQIGGGGPLSEYRGWQFARDTTTTSLDDQQMIVWYLSAWGPLSNGNIEITAKLVRPVWDVADKCGWIADVALSIDASERDSYSEAPCLAHMGWLTLDTTTGNNAGRRHWQTAANRPTIFLVPNQTYMQDADVGAWPPYSETSYPDATTTNASTYIPGWSYTHRQNLDDTSGYYGRGPICLGEASMLMRICQDIGTNSAQMAEIATATLSATAGIHFPMNFRTSTNTLIPMITDYPGVTRASTVYNADGLGNTQYAYREGGASLQGGYTSATGGYSGTSPYTWCYRWTGTDDHSTNAVAFMYQYLGEPYLYDAVLDTAMGYIHRKDGSADQGRSKLLHNEISARQSAYSISTTDVYDTVAFNTNANIRAHCFHFTMLSPAWAFCADDDKHRNMMNHIQEVHEAWLDDVIAYLPTSMTDRGLIWENAAKGDTKEESGYMHSLISLGAMRAYSLTRSASIKAVCEILINFDHLMVDESCYMPETYRISLKPSDVSGTYDSAPELGAGYYSRPRWTTNDGTASITVADNVVTYAHPLGGTWNNGDKVQVDTDTTYPSELTPGTDYYIISASGGTSFKLSTTSGGSEIDFTGSDSTARFMIEMNNWDISVVGTGGWRSAAATVVGDEYFNISRAAIHWACHLDLTNKSTTLAAKCETFANGEDIEYATWFITTV